MGSLSTTKTTSNARNHIVKNHPDHPYGQALRKANTDRAKKELQDYDASTATTEARDDGYVPGSEGDSIGIHEKRQGQIHSIKHAFKKARIARVDILVARWLIRKGTDKMWSILKISG